jgi:hypothetical protein
MDTLSNFFNTTFHEYFPRLSTKSPALKAIGDTIEHGRTLGETIRQAYEPKLGPTPHKYPKPAPQRRSRGPTGKRRRRYSKRIRNRKNF